MAAKPITFETVRGIALTLPGLEESTAFGKPAFKLHGQLVVTLPSHKSAEPHSLVVRVDITDRAEMLATDPRVFYLTDHYVGYDAVLVRMAHIRPEMLEGLLRTAYHFVDRKIKTRAAERRRAK